MTDYLIDNNETTHPNSVEYELLGDNSEDVVDNLAEHITQKNIQTIYMSERTAEFLLFHIVGYGVNVSTLNLYANGRLPDFFNGIPIVIDDEIGYKTIRSMIKPPIFFDED